MRVCVFFNDTATTEIYTYGHTLSLHDALPIWPSRHTSSSAATISAIRSRNHGSYLAIPWISATVKPSRNRSEEHTSELQSLMRISYAVFCLKKKMNEQQHIIKIELYKILT